MSVGEFGSALRELRLAAGLSQEALAERARLSPGAISALERSARRGPQHQTLALIVEALQLDVPARERLEGLAHAASRRVPRVGWSEPGVTRLKIPHSFTSFHGRQAELTELDQLLETRRLISLLGAGGVGKTRVALEVARGRPARTRFTDGITFVDFAPVADPEVLASTIAALLEVRERDGVALTDAIAATIDSKAMLLVLDNCEHLVEGCARITEALLRACPRLAVLVTTREALRIEAECVFRIEPLPYDDGDRRSPALDLFLDRLADADVARFTRPSNADVVHAATICRRLDGIPLALELAAGCARSMPLAHIAGGLDERFGLLVSGRRTALPRQTTLRGMIDWSFEPLAAADRDLFARLGLFAQAFTPEAASAVCGGDAGTLRSGLATLIAKSLIGVVEDPNGAMRYRLLETMRAYALERLREGGQYERYARRFATYYCDLALQADARFGRVGNGAFFASIANDLDHFRAALEWSLGRRNDVVLGARLAGAMGSVYRACALFSESTRWTQRGLDVAAVLPLATVARLRMAASCSSLNAGAPERALHEAREATASYRAAASEPDVAWTRAQEGGCLLLLGRPDDARVPIEEAVALARKHGDLLRLGAALNVLAMTIPIERGTERLAVLEESIRVHRALVPGNEIMPMGNLAESHYALGDYAAALAIGAQVVTLARASRDRLYLVAALGSFAACAFKIDDIEAADAAAHEAMDLTREIGTTYLTTSIFLRLGTIACRRGAFERAARLLGASDRCRRDMNAPRDTPDQAEYDRSIGSIRDAIGDVRLLMRLEEGAAMAPADAMDEALARTVS